MVTGVNSNYYNYYNAFPQQIGTQIPTTNFMANPQSIMPQSVSAKTSADGSDDGVISLGSKLKNIGKGSIKFFTGLFTDEKGNFSLFQTLKTAAIGIGVGAACILTAGTAVPAIIAATGVAVSGIGLAKAGVQAALADTDAEAEQAWQSIGSNSVALGLSVAGAKAVAKSNTIRAGESVEQFQGLRGTANAVKQVFTDSAKPFRASFNGVKDAYQGASFTDKIINSFAKLKDNTTAQFSEFATTVEGNFNKTVYGTSAKVAETADKLAQKKSALQDEMSKITDKTSKKYKALENKVKTIEAKEAGMREINSTTSWSEANSKIEANRAILEGKKAELTTATGADKARLNAQISELKAKIDTQESVLSRRTAEVRAIDKRIETLTEKMNKEGVSPAKQAIYQSEIDFLETQKTNANFKLPASEGQPVNLKDLLNQKAKAVSADLKLKKLEIDPKADYYEYLTAEVDARNAQTEYTTMSNLYKQQQIAKPGGYKKFVADEIVRGSIEELKQGNIKDNFIHQNNPSQWLTTGIAGRQFGETTESRFISQLSPEEVAQYKKLPYAQKLAMINRFEQM